MIRDHADSIVAGLLRRGRGVRAVIAFDIPLVGDVVGDKVRAELARQGYTRADIGAT